MFLNDLLAAEYLSEAIEYGGPFTNEMGWAARRGRRWVGRRHGAPPPLVFLSLFEPGECWAGAGTSRLTEWHHHGAVLPGQAAGSPVVFSRPLLAGAGGGGLGNLGDIHIQFQVEEQMRATITNNNGNKPPEKKPLGFHLDLIGELFARVKF